MSDLSMKSSNMKLSTLVFIILGMICGGSFGVESMIGASGPGLALLGLVLVPIFWAAPISLVAAELGSAFPEEGGAYVWVRRALGPFAGFMVAAGRTLYCWVGAGSALALTMMYIGTYFGIDKKFALLIVFGVCIISVIINVIGLDLVGKTSTFMMILIMVPSVLLFIIGLTKLQFNPVQPFMNPNNTVAQNLGYVFALGIWLYGGFENVAAISGEIKNFSKIFPKALLIVVVSMIVIYMAPNLAGVAAYGHWKDWGNTVDIASVTFVVCGNLIGWLMLLAAILSNVLLFIGGMTHSARNPMVLARDNLFPKVFGKLHPKYKTPYVSIIAVAVVGIFACFFDFNVIIQFLVSINFMLELLLLLAAYILRIKEPNINRPYKVPGGKTGIAVLTLPIVLISIYSILGNGIAAIIGLIVVVIGMPVIYTIFKKMYGGIAPD